MFCDFICYIEWKRKEMKKFSVEKEFQWKLSICWSTYICSIRNRRLSSGKGLKLNFEKVMNRNQLLPSAHCFFSVNAKIIMQGSHLKKRILRTKHHKSSHSLTRFISICHSHVDLCGNTIQWNDDDDWNKRIHIDKIEILQCIISRLWMLNICMYPMV